MEMAGHGDLLEYIKLRGAIPNEKCIPMFINIIDGVEYLHTNGIVHRYYTQIIVFLPVMVVQWENECISLSALSVARVMIDQWENECISLSILSVARVIDNSVEE